MCNPPSTSRPFAFFLQFVVKQINFLRAVGDTFLSLCVWWPDIAKMTMLNPQFNNLPKLPGMGFGEELLRTDFRKSQLLNSKTGVQDKRVKPDVQPFDTLRLANTQLGGNTQAKMSLDRKVLRFQAFFKEGVHESPQEQVCDWAL